MLNLLRQMNVVIKIMFMGRLLKKFMRKDASSH